MGGKTIRTETDKILGIQLNSATYGVVIPIVLGTSRIAGNIIDYYDFTAIPHTETQRAGKGGVTMKHTSYTYEAAVLIGLAEGPSGGIGKVWANGEVYDNLAALNLTLFNGIYGQTPWSYTQSRHPEKALPYSGLAYVAGVIGMGQTGAPPVLNFEYKGLLRDTGDGIDVNPADAIAFICTDPLNGVGFGIGGIDTESLKRYRRYCKAADLLISVPLTETKKAYEIINEICKATNTIVFWSPNKLKFVPKCDERLERGGVVYEPDLTPLYDLGPDDFLEMDNGQLVKFEREDNAEAYNHVPVEFLNRANSYEKEIAEAKIQVDINRRGLRSMSAVNIPYIHTKARAEYVANQMVMESLYGRNKYIFRLGWSHCLLEPGDFVTIYDPVISPDKIPVTIDSIEENEDGALEVVAKGRPPGIYSPARYTTYEAERPEIDRNVPPGPTTATVFNPSPEYAGQLEAWIAASGGPDWGGCHVWVSDSGEQYAHVGTIDAPSRHGVLMADLPAGDAIDTQNLLRVQLVGGGPLLSGTQQDAHNLNTLCWVNGELIAYATATLAGDKQYTLSYLVRGVYNTPIKNHPAGSKFVRLDRGMFRYPFDVDRLGKQIYIKLTSYNIHGSATQSLAEVTPITHTLSAQLPPDVSNIVIDEDTYRLRDGTVLSDIIVSFDAPKYLALSHYNIFYDLNDTGWTFAGMTDKSTYVIKALPQAKTIKVKVTTVGAGLESEGTISTPYTIIGKSAAPPDVTWGECSFIDRIILRWNAVEGSDIDKYEVRLDTNFGADDANLIYRGDGLSCTIEKPTQREYRFWIKALDRSGNYSVNATDITLENPVPSTPAQPTIAPFFSSLWIEIHPVLDNDIKGYALYMTPCDEQSEPTGDAQRILYPTAQRVTWYATPNSHFLVQVAAFDVLGEGEKSSPILARTRTIDEVAAFAQDIVFPRIVDELPELPNPQYPEGSFVVLKTNHRFYRNVDEEWDDSVSVEQIVGKITAGMIAAGAIGAAEIAAGALRADHFAAGSIEAYVAAVQEAFIDSAKIISIEADKIKVGGSSAPIPLAIQPGDTLFRFDGSLLSTQGIKPIGYDTAERTEYGLVTGDDLCATLLPEGGVAVTEGTTNLLATRTSPAPEVVAVSKGQKYTLSAYGSGNAQVYQQQVDDTQSDWQQGTLDGVVATAAGDVELAGEFSDDFDRSTLGPDWEIAPDAQGSVQLQNGELVLTGGSSLRMWVRTTRTFEAHSIVFRARRDSEDAGSDVGLAFNWDGNLATSGAGEPLNGYRLFWRVWETTSTLRIARYDNGVSTVLASIEFPPDNNEHEFAILIEDGTIRVFVDGVQMLQASDSTYTSGYIGLTAREGGNRRGRYNWIVVNREPLGSRVSPVLDLSPVGTAAGSSIAWNATTPSGTSVTVETNLSLDGGVTWQGWQQATNGGPIPGISAGTDLSNARLQTRVTLQTTDPTMTPRVDSLTVEVGHQAVVVAAESLSQSSPLTFTAVGNRVRLVPSAGVTKWQLEQKPYATPFAEGARPAGKLSYDLPISINGDWTIAKWLELEPYFMDKSYSGDKPTDKHRLPLIEIGTEYYATGYGVLGVYGAWADNEPGKTIRIMANKDEAVVYSSSPETISLTEAEYNNKLLVVLTKSGPMLSAYIYTVQNKYVLTCDITSLGDISQIAPRLNYHTVTTSNRMYSKRHLNTLVCRPYAVSPETVATWHSLDAPFFDPREITTAELAAREYADQKAAEDIDASKRKIYAGNIEFTGEGQKNTAQGSDGVRRVVYEQDILGNQKYYDKDTGEHMFTITNRGELRDRDNYPIIDINGRYNGKIIRNGILGDWVGPDDTVYLGNYVVPQGRQLVTIIVPFYILIPPSNPNKTLKAIGTGDYIINTKVQYNYTGDWTSSNILPAGSYSNLRVSLNHEAWFDYSYTDGTSEGVGKVFPAYYEIKEISV